MIQIEDRHLKKRLLQLAAVSKEKSTRHVFLEEW